MSDPLQVTLVDNQPTLKLTADIATHLDVQAGGEVVAIATEDGVVLVPASVETDQQLKVMQNVMEARKKALNKLAE